MTDNRPSFNDLVREAQEHDRAVNRLVNRNNELLSDRKKLVEEYKNLVEEYNKLVVDYNDLGKSYNCLKILTNDNDDKLERKKRKIRELKELLGKSKEEILDYKIKTKEGRLEIFVKKLEIDRGKIRELRNIYQQLVRISVIDNQDDIDELEDKIEVISDDLVDKGISIVSAKKVCQKCEKIAKLKLEQDKLYRERFEERQEVALYNKK